MTTIEHAIPKCSYEPCDEMGWHACFRCQRPTCREPRFAETDRHYTMNICERCVEEQTEEYDLER